MNLLVDGLATHYRDEGKGSLIVLLHGWQDTLSTFDGLTEQLHNHFRLVRLDLPGFGATELPPDAWSLDQYVHFVDHFLTKLDLQPFTLLGHSFGGRIILKGVSEQKLSAEKLILIASAGVQVERPSKSVSKLTSSVSQLAAQVPGLRGLRNRLRQNYYQKLGSDYLQAGPLTQTYLNIIGEDLKPAVAKIKQPTLLIWGEADTATPLADGQLLAKLIPRAELKIIPGASHFVHQEKSYEVSDLIRSFLT